MDKSLIDRLTDFRHELHREPEVSGQEYKTAEKVQRFLHVYEPDELLTGLGGTGVAAVFSGKEEGPTVMIRCELDALPIHEINDDLAYRSIHDNVGHKCGHDGHMAIVAGLADGLSRERPKKGRVVLLFQPSEEMGEGAERTVKDDRFRSIEPDYIFALHNIPGMKKDTIAVKEGPFAFASIGMEVKLSGKTSHAAFPEDGIHPAGPVASIIGALNSLTKQLELKDFGLVTIIHIMLGEEAYGTSPSDARVLVTLRAALDEDLALMKKRAEELVKEAADTGRLKCEITYTEEFQATVNDPECAGIVEEAALANGFELRKMESANRWSEDFGVFTALYKGAQFGIGAGEKQPQLHNPDYDFPDELIPSGMKMFQSIIDKILNADTEAGKQ